MREPTDEERLIATATGITIGDALARELNGHIEQFLRSLLDAIKQLKDHDIDPAPVSELAADLLRRTADELTRPV